jgi:very-short-patch-repair endonuclease
MSNPWKDSDGFAAQAAKVESAGEALLLTLLWWRRDGWTVRTQEQIEQYRIDIAVPEAKLAIEVDSFEAHGSAAAMEHDAARSNLLVSKGWVVVRYSVRQTIAKAWQCASEVLAQIQRRAPSTYRPPVERTSIVSRPPVFDPVAMHAGASELLATLEKAGSVGELPPAPRRRR